jgi:hypothetical protein
LHKLEQDAGKVRGLTAQRAPATLAPSVMQAVSELGPVRGRGGPVPHWQGFAIAACLFAAIGFGVLFLGGITVAYRLGSEAALANTKAHQANEVHLAFAQLEEEPAKKRLAAELKKHPALWCDLPAVNTPRAVERLTEAFQFFGITVLVDLGARENISKKSPKIQFVLYAENVSQEEAGKIFQRIATAESVTAKKALEWMVMADITAENRMELASAMQVDAQSLRPASEGPELPTIMDIPDNQNARAAVAPKQQERFAVLLTYRGAGPPADSVEVRQFINSRRGIRPGTVQMILVIHDELS